MFTCRIPSPTLSLARLLLLGACLSSSAAAQTPFDDGVTGTISWPSSSLSAPPTRAFAGEFTNDRYRDIIYLCGSQAVMAYGVGYHNYVQVLPGDVVDIARLPKQAGYDEDGVIILNDTGLRKLTRWSAGAWAVAGLNDSVEWKSAVRVVTGDVDDDGKLDAVGVAADLRTVLVSSDVLHDPSAPTSFTMTGDILDLLIADWSPAPAIVILSTDGMFVRTHTNAVVIDYPGGTYDAAQLTLVNDASVSHQAVGAVYTVAGSDYVSIVDKDGPNSFKSLGAIGAISIAAGDVDQNGVDDVVVLQRFNHWGLLWHNAGSANGGLGALQGVDLEIPPAAPASGMSAQAVLSDFTNDGDADLVVHVAASATYPNPAEDPRLLGFENNSFDHSLLAPEAKSGVYSYSFNQKEGELLLNVEVPSNSSYSPTDVEFFVWTQGDSSAPVDPVAHEHDFGGIDALGYAQISFTAEEEDVETSKLYHIEMRPVVRNGGGAVAGVGPTSVWSFATAGGDVTELQNQGSGDTVELDIYVLDWLRIMTFLEEEERVLTPSAVDTEKVPPMEEPPNPFGGN